MDIAVMKKRKQERHKLVRQLFAEQKTVREMAAITGVSHAQIGYDLRDMGLKRIRRTKRKPDQALVKRVVAMRQSGASYEQIKNATGLSWQRARAVIREHVPELVRTTASMDRDPPYANEVLTMTLAGMSRVDQAKELGISAIYVSKIKERLVKQKKL